MASLLVGGLDGTQALVLLTNGEDSVAADALNLQGIAAIADRAIGYLSGATVSALVYLGDQLGLYRALREGGPLTSGELAARLGLHERWVREWLHGQASAGLVCYAGDGRFELTGAQAAVLADEANPSFAAGGFALVFSLFQPWERLHESFRTGRGIAYNQLGADHALAEGRFSAPWMRANLVPVIIPGLDGVTSKLAAGAKVADVGCGSGRALLEMARAYPNSEFHGYDSSALAIRFAKEHLAASGLTNVTFHHAAADTIEPDASFDFILTWDCLHDMTDPPRAMRAIRSAIKPDGTWLIVDINGMPRQRKTTITRLPGSFTGSRYWTAWGAARLKRVAPALEPWAYRSRWPDGWPPRRALRVSP